MNAPVMVLKSAFRILLSLALLLSWVEGSAGQLPRLVTFQGKPVSFWMMQLQAKDVVLRQEAARILTVIGPNADEAVPALIAALDDSDVQVRWRVLEALGSVGRKASAAAPLLLPFLNDHDGQWRERVVQTIGQIGARDNRIVLALTAALLDERPSWRTLSAGKILAQFGSDAKPALPYLREGLKSKDADLRASVLLPLVSIDAEAVPLVVSALDDAQPRVREAAVAVLQELGPRAKGSLPILMNRLRKGDRPAEVGQILVAMGADAVPDLVQALRDPQIGAMAATTLASMGPIPVSRLLDAVKDREARLNALEALARLGPVAKEAIPPLVAQLKDADPSTRAAIQATLARMGKAVLPAIVAELRDIENEHVPGLIGQLSTGAEGARATVSALVKLLRDPAPPVRIRAAQQLGRMGMLARRAVPALQELHRSENEALRRSAEEALKQIGRLR